MLERTFGEKKGSAGKSTNKVMPVGVLTGRPAEEMPGSTGDLLPELLQLLDRVRKAMRGVAQALWPSHSMPEGLGVLEDKLKGARRVMHGVAQALWPTSSLPNGMGELVDMLQGARRHFQLWKI